MQSTRPPNRTGLPFTSIPSGRADLRTNFPSSHSKDKQTSGPSLPPAPSLSPLDRNGQTLEPEGHSFPLSTLIDSRRWDCLWKIENVESATSKAFDRAPCARGRKAPEAPQIRACLAKAFPGLGSLNLGERELPGATGLAGCGWPRGWVDRKGALGCWWPARNCFWL